MHIALVMNLLQVEFFNYLTVPRTEDQRNKEETVAKTENQQNDVGTKIPEDSKIFVFPLQYFKDFS